MAINLVKFMKIRDLEILNQAIHELEPLTDADRNLLKELIDKWEAEQAIANLLYYPGIIPQEFRYDAIYKALCDDSAPYYTLAATVGLQTLGSNISAVMRTKFSLQLMEIIKNDSDILASRASITVWDLLDTRSFPLFLQLYPVTSTSANKNILALVFQKLHQLNKRAFRQKLKEYKVSWICRRKYMNQFNKYKKAQKKGMDAILYAPVYDAIPNLSDVDQHPDVSADVVMQVG